MTIENLNETMINAPAVIQAALAEAAREMGDGPLPKVSVSPEWLAGFTWGEMDPQSPGTLTIRLEHIRRARAALAKARGEPAPPVPAPPLSREPEPEET